YPDRALCSPYRKIVRGGASIKTHKNRQSDAGYFSQHSEFTMSGRDRRPADFAELARQKKLYERKWVWQNIRHKLIELIREQPGATGGSDNNGNVDEATNSRYQPSSFQYTILKNELIHRINVHARRGGRLEQTFGFSSCTCHRFLDEQVAARADERLGNRVVGYFRRTDVNNSWIALREHLLDMHKWCSRTGTLR